MKFDDSKIQEWVTSGLISKQQAEGILKYEDTIPKKSWVLPGFLILGVVVVGLGLISITAANWALIPPSTKLLANFLLLSALAAATIQSWQQNKFLRSDILLIGYFISILASIGLIAQIYNTSGELYQMLFFWSVITCGAVLAGKHFFVSLFWLSGFLIATYFYCFDSIFGRSIFSYNLALISMNICFLCISCLAASKSLSAESGFTRSWRFWSLFSGFLTFLFAEIFRTPNHFENSIIFDNAYQENLFLSYNLRFYLLISTSYLIWQTTAYTKAQKHLILVVLCLLFLIGNIGVLGIEPSIFYAICTISTLCIMAFLAVSLQNKRLFNLCLVLLGLRFMVLYFQALGGLATTGIGLIIAGALIIAFTIAWYKYGAILWNKVARLTYDIK